MVINYKYNTLYYSILLFLMTSLYKNWDADSILFVGISNEDHFISTSFSPSLSGQE